MPKGIGPGFYSAMICSFVGFLLPDCSKITTEWHFFGKMAKNIETNASWARLY
jgi:hypothetical protein